MSSRMSISFGNEHANLRPPLGLVLAGIVAVLGLYSPAHAQFPSRPVRMIIPAVAGGPTDIVGRVVAQGLSTLWGQPVIVDNRPSAGGIVGTEAAVKSAPDGHTLLMSSAVPIVMSKSLIPGLPFDPLKDLAPISQIASVPQILYVSPALPVRDAAELIAYVKQRPGQLNFSSVGPGTMPHLAGELFKRQAGLEMVHVPYKGAPAAGAAVMSGDVALYFDTPAALTHVRAGKLRALLVTAPRRLGGAPDVPTAQEAGLPGFSADSWYGLLAPAQTTRELRDRIHADLIKILAPGDTRSRITNMGFEIVASSPGGFADTIANESARWSALIKSVGIRAD